MRKKTILIVDDEHDLVETVQMRLELEGFECLAAHDGNHGLEQAQNEKPDLIVLDLMLPGMNGYKICRLLKFDERYKQIPIIMLTAQAQQEDRSLGEETGADLYMTKPFSVEELVAKIHEFLAD